MIFYSILQHASSCTEDIKHPLLAGFQYTNVSILSP